MAATLLYLLYSTLYCIVKGVNRQNDIDYYSCFQVTTRNLGVGGRIFAIESTRTRTGNMLKLKVNFLPEIITLAKEVQLQIKTLHAYFK